MSVAHATGAPPRRWLARRPVLANAAAVGALTSAAKLAAAVKIAVAAGFFGAGDEMDAYVTAMLVPAMFGDTVAGAFTPSLVPALIRVEREQGAGAARGLAQSGAVGAAAIMLAMALVFAAAAPWALPALGLNFSASKMRLTQTLFYGFLCWLPLGALIASWRAVLNAHGRFWLAAAAPLATPALSIAFLYAAAERWGVFVMVAGALAGLAVECALLAASVRRLGYAALVSRPEWTPEVRAVSEQFLALAASAILIAATTLIDQAFAGALEAGSVSALAFGTRLPGVVAVVAGSAIATAALPEFSRFAAGNHWRALRRAALAYGGTLAALTIPLAAALMWFSEPLARLIYERGAFDAADTLLVASVQRLALVGTPLAVLFAVVSRVATAAGANRMLAQTGLVLLVVNTGADWLFSRWMGVAGLALAKSLVLAAGVALLVVLLRRREPRLFAEERGA
jgi:putative peptidoglycan lipid II flippase